MDHIAIYASNFTINPSQNRIFNPYMRTNNYIVRCCLQIFYCSSNTEKKNRGTKSLQHNIKDKYLNIIV
jgi:hypothetical protein